MQFCGGVHFLQQINKYILWDKICSTPSPGLTVGKQPDKTGLAGYSQVDTLASQYKIVNFGELRPHLTESGNPVALQKSIPHKSVNLSFILEIRSRQLILYISDNEG